MYFDEDLLLDLRLNILNNYVKKFVVVESSYLHSGNKKKLNFDIKNFPKFKDKIEYLVLDNQPNEIQEVLPKDSEDIRNEKKLKNSVKRENSQRNYILKGLDKASDEDLIIISDLDEIPNPSSFNFKKKINLFIQKIFYYKFNLVQQNLNWIGSRACKKKYLISPQWLRNIKDRPYPYWRIDALFSQKKYWSVNLIPNGGWHFTNIKSPEDIHFKLSNFLHHVEFEYSKLTVSDMEKMIKNKVIAYDHSVDKTQDKYSGKQKLTRISDEMLPEYIKINKNKYKKWLD
tara:strand:+ start:1868 stop:2728 length:861 start_codon:yes stop_codon:yes gene_type:complete